MKSNDEISCTESSCKPIKKRVVDDDGAGDDGDFDDYHDSRLSTSANNSKINGDASGSEANSSETKAWNDLKDYLEGKGIDTVKELGGYRVHVQLSKNRRLPAGSYIVTYSGPDGDILTSKSDVLSAVKRSVALNANKLHIPRADIYAASQSNFNDLMEEEGLPVDIDGIRVLSFGVIDSDNSAFHSPVDIWPIGYTAELSIPATPALRGRSFVRSSTVILLHCSNLNFFYLSGRLFDGVGNHCCQ